MCDDVGSVTEWICDLKEGRNVDTATRLIWERYFERLVGLARTRLQSRPVGPVGDEDVALSTFDCLFRGLTEGRYPDLREREGLFRMLVTITARKASKGVRKEKQKIRGGGQVVQEATLRRGEDAPAGLDGFAGSEPTPEFAVMLADEFRWLLNKLPDDLFRKIAALRMEQFTGQEIADQLDIPLRTIERKLAAIRSNWAEELA